MMDETKDAITIIAHMIGDDAELRQMCAEASVHARVAQLIYDARTEAGMSQRELATLVGTTQSVISRLEDADCEEV